MDGYCAVSIADQAICSISISALEFLYLFQLCLILAIYAGVLLTSLYNENFPWSAALHVSVSCNNLDRKLKDLFPNPNCILVCSRSFRCTI